MKYAAPRPYADPEVAARRLMEIASTVKPVQDGRIYVELINGPFRQGHPGRVRRGHEAGAGTRLG